MRRREFIAALIGAHASATAWAQGTDQRRTVGIIMPFTATDAEVRGRVSAFRQELQTYGWQAGANLRIEERWATDDSGLQAATAELIALKPDVILTTGARPLPFLQQQARAIPVVFVAISDPVGRGLVASFARPGGNMTGFALADVALNSKLLDLLKQVAPSIRRAVLVLATPDNPAQAYNIDAFKDAGTKLGIETVINRVTHPENLERAVEADARQPNTGFVFPSVLPNVADRDLVIAVTARHRIPAAFPDREMALRGGLLSYSPDRTDLFRRSADYVDRIMRGANPAELPVQQATKYELVINLKAANMLALDVPSSVLARADEVIE